ncbi:MAG: YIP1 family protein [Acidobacteriota bacterium]|nr:YIP1 family protein [Acidobacteriota bacterium]
MFQRIAGVLFAPAESFEEIARKPDIVAPMLVIVAISFLTVAAIVPRFDMESLISNQRETIQKQNPNMTEADFERIGRMTSAFAKVMFWLSPLFNLIVYVVFASVLLFAFRLMAGEGTFAQAVSATLYAFIPLVLFSIILAIVVLVQGSFDPVTAPTIVKSNPAFLVDFKEQPVLFSLLSSLDLFTIWTVVLLIFGFAALSKLPRARSAAIVIFLWFVFILVRVGFAAMGAARMKG